MNELPLELIIEIFEKISLSDFKSFITISKVSKKFNFVYKKYFEEKLKNFKPYIPLKFWFNRNPMISLQLIALQYHEVNVTLDFIQNLVNEEVEVKTNKKRNGKTKTKNCFIRF
jgi:hypothetical protein